MLVCGVIAEYDPFHLGHARHLRLAREASGADYVVCVISCAFSQRGTPTLFHTHDRAKMALSSGANLVLGMPYSFSCAPADRFALGGIGILDGLGVVTHLSFGTEVDDLQHLYNIASMIEHPNTTYRQKLRLGIAEGKSFARARGEALNASYPGVQKAFLSQPNMTLAISYLRALKRLGSRMEVVPMKRNTAYQSTALAHEPSASAVRLAMLRGDWQGVQRSVPDAVYTIIQDAANTNRLHRPESLDKALISHLLQTTPVQAARCPDVSEGLERRILKAAKSAVTREQLVDIVKTKRYPYARINRILSHMFTGQTRNNLADIPQYARLLGYSREAAPLLKALRLNGIQLISKPARETVDGSEQDMLAETLWALGAGLPPDSAYRHPVVTY